jgi:hypothetical protein
MFFPEGHIRVFLYGKPVDMRNSFTGLYALMLWPKVIANGVHGCCE